MGQGRLPLPPARLPPCTSEWISRLKTPALCRAEGCPWVRDAASALNLYTDVGRDVGNQAERRRAHHCSAALRVRIYRPVDRSHLACGQPAEARVARCAAVPQHLLAVDPARLRPRRRFGARARPGCPASAGTPATGRRWHRHPRRSWPIPAPRRSRPLCTASSGCRPRSGSRRRARKNPGARRRRNGAGSPSMESNSTA